MNKKTIAIIIIALLILLDGIYYFQQAGESTQSLNSTTNTTDSTVAVDKNLVEIFHLPHAPAVAVVKKVEEVLKKYPNYTVKKYDFDDPANDKVVAEHNLSGHIPVAIFIGGKNTFTVDGKEMTFENFPKSDNFIPGFGGSWDYADVEKVLANPSK